MKSKGKIILIIAITAVVSSSLTGIALLGGINNAMRSGELKYGGAAKINMIDRMIDKNYLYSDDVDKDKLMEGAAKGYVEALNEPYTHYYTKEEFSDYTAATEESYVGIGVVISVDNEVGKIMIIAPTEGSPAYEAGIKPGDYIVSVDGESFTAEQMDGCVKKIKSGKAGTNVNVTIERNGTQEDYTIERKEIIQESVKAEMLDNSVGYVRITAFNTSQGNSENDTFTEFKEQVDNLKAEGMEKMVIDLRDNPGGVLDIVCDIADYILPEGIITYTETKSGKREEFKSDASELNIPMAVLINGNSASASEVLTGALKDYKRAIIVGEKSFGKGIVQQVFPFSDGSGMSMTIAKYYSPNGVCIHGEGIEPDYTVELPDKYKDMYASQVPKEDDAQLQKALELLQ